MSGLLLCAACLNNEVNLIPIDTSQLRDHFDVICSVQTQHVPGVSQYLCVMCVAYLRKMMKLREQCLTSSQHFQEIFHKCQEENRECTTEDMKPISRLSMLSFTKFDRFEYSEIHEKDIKNRNPKVISLSSEKIPTLHYDLNNCKNSIEAINDNDTNRSVIITENIKLEIGSQYNQSNFVSVLNENTDYDSLHNQDNVSDTNNCNLSFENMDNYDSIDNQDAVSDTNNSFENIDNYDSIDNQDAVSDTNNSFENIDNYDSIGNQDAVSDTNNYNLSVLDANDNEDDTEDNSHTQNNVQEFENVVSDSIELPSGMYKNRLKFIDYYAKLELLPENEARAAHELQLKIYFRNPNEEKPFCRCKKCTICDQIVYRNQLTAHKSAHKEIGPNHCSVCFINMRSENSLKEHNVQYHMFKYICRICYEVSFTIVNAEAHYKAKHNNIDLGVLEHMLEVDGASITRKSVDYIDKFFTITPVLSDIEKKEIFNQRQFQQHYIVAKFKCGICFKAIKSKELMQKHMPVHIKNKRETDECSLCRVYFDQKYKLLIHNKREHDYKYRCNECGEVVYSRMSASKHRSEQHKKVKFLPIATTCRYCNIEFKSKYKLNKHMATHNSVFCFECGRIFESKHSVSIHVGVAHEQMYDLYIKATYDPDRSSPFYCGECHVQFHSAVAYNRHLTFKEHKDPTPVECNTKDNQNNVQKKKAINSKVSVSAPRAMNCHLCGVFLSNVKIARAHYKEVHTVAEYDKHIYTTTFKCEQCDYSSMNPQHFKIHVRKHTFSIPCQICGKRFNSFKRLNCHLTVHSDKRPYECEHCHKTFKTKIMTQSHIKVVHLKIPYMPWVRRAERRKRERELERQKRAKESQGKDKNKYKISKIKTEKPQQDMVVNMMDEEQYLATEYLSNFVRSGNVVFATHSRSGYQKS